MTLFPSIDQLRNSYQVGYDNSLRVIYANGMDTHYQTEPHILAGAANPTVARRNMTLPGESGQNLVEWRFRKEQTRGKVIVFGRKLRVGLSSNTYTHTHLHSNLCSLHRRTYTVLQSNSKRINMSEHYIIYQSQAL